MAGKFLSDSFHTDQLYVERFSDHIGQAVPTGIPIHAVTVGKVKLILDNPMNVVDMINL